MLCRLPGPLAAPALLASLRRVEPDHAGGIARRLLEAVDAPGRGPAAFEALRRVGYDRALEVIASRWSDYPPAQRRRLAARIGVDRLAECAGSMAEGDLAARRAVASMLLSTPDARLAPVAARLALDSDGSVAQAAAAALLTLARTCAEPQERAAVDQAVAAALHQAARGTPEDVLAAGLALAARPGAAIDALLRDDGHPSHLLLRAAARRERRPDIQRRAVDWLKSDALAPAALDLLSNPNRAAATAAALDRAHLLLHPDRRRRLRRPAGRTPVIDALEDREASQRACLGRLRWLEALPLRHQQRTDRLAARAQDPLPAVRLLAAHRLAEAPRPDAAVRDALADFADDPEPRIARVAFEELTGPGDPAAPMLVDRFCQSSDAGLRRDAHAARRTLRYLDPAPPDPLEDLAEARLALARDRAGVVRVIQRAAAAGPPAARMRAIRIGRRLGLTDDLQLELLAALGDEDARLAATAAMALARAGGRSAEEGLRAALGHRDGRVRANALEALALRSAAHEELAQRQRDPVARVRANALDAMLRLRGDLGAREGLASMLRDRRPAHRRSAVWVVSRVGGEGWTADLAALAQEDDVPEVRRCARRCARRLLARMDARGLARRTRPALTPA